jgi:hypothetical protein
MPDEAVLGAEAPQTSLSLAEARRQLERVVHRAVHAARRWPAGDLASASDTTVKRVHVALQHARMRALRPGRKRRRWQGRHFEAIARRTSNKRPTGRLAAVEAGQLLVAEGHHVVGREDHARTEPPRLRQRVVPDVRVDEVRMDDVRPPLVQHRLERPIDDLVVQRTPCAEAHGVVRVQAEHRRPEDPGRRRFAARADRGDDRGLVAQAAELGGVLESLACAGAHTRVPHLDEDEHSHQRPAPAAEPETTPDAR